MGSRMQTKTDALWASRPSHWAHKKGLMGAGTSPVKTIWRCLQRRAQSLKDTRGTGCGLTAPLAGTRGLNQRWAPGAPPPQSQLRPLDPDFLWILAEPSHRPQCLELPLLSCQPEPLEGARVCLGWWEPDP